jgi:hypothetical protein
VRWAHKVAELGAHVKALLLGLSVTLWHGGHLRCVVQSFETLTDTPFLLLHHVSELRGVGSPFEFHVEHRLEATCDALVVDPALQLLNGESIPIVCLLRERRGPTTFDICGINNPNI